MDSDNSSWRSSMGNAEHLGTELHTASNAWKPKKRAVRASSEETEDDALLKEARSILNKITPQKFETLKNRFLDLKVQNEAQLQGVAKLILMQVSLQPGFSELYAEICSNLKDLMVPSQLNPESEVGFIKVLESKCLDLINNPPKADKQKETYLSDFEMENKLKDIFLGTVKFIGQLYNKDVVSHDVVHELIERFTEHDLQSVAVFMTTIGPYLDRSAKSIQEKLKVDIYFDKLESVVRDATESTRIRILILELLDLRRHGWNAKQDSKPKTIDEVHKDAAAAREENRELLSAQEYNHANEAWLGDNELESKEYTEEDFIRLRERISGWKVNPDTLFWPHFMKKAVVPGSTGCNIIQDGRGCTDEELKFSVYGNRFQDDEQEDTTTLKSSSNLRKFGSFRDLRYLSD